MKLIKTISLTLAAMICVTCLGSCSGDKTSLAADKEQFSSLEKGEKIAVVKTSAGIMKFRLFPDAAPKAVENFEGLIKKSYYDQTSTNTMTIFRLNDTMFQTGDPSNEGTGGESFFGSSFGQELDRNVYHFTGALCMAATSTGDQTSQFYVIHGDSVHNEDGTVTSTQKKSFKLGGWPDWAVDDYKKYGGETYYDGRYTVFGQMVEGYDVLAKIGSIPRTDEKPSTKVEIISISIIEFDGENVNFELPYDVSKGESANVSDTSSSSTSSGALVDFN